jgi:GT2 family glycosyltransferase
MVRRLPTPAALILEALLLNRLWPGNPVNRRYRGLDWDTGVRIEVEQPAGAFLMIRREVWKELGGFDEGFFPLWFEDVDLCRRVIDRGYRLYYVPEAVAKHTGAHSIARLPVELIRFYWYCSLLRYSAKHFRPVSHRAVCAAVIAGSFLRMIGGSASEGSRKSIAAYGKVVRLAGRCLVSGWRDDAVLRGPLNS